MDSNGVVLRVENVSLSFGGIKTLSDVSFQVRNKKIVGLIGPNGSGKTSVLNVINGFYRAEKGSVLLEGVDIINKPPHKIAELRVARSFQHMELFGGMTVLENLLVGAHPRTRANIFSAGIYWGLAQKSEIELRKIAEDVLDFMELEKYRKLPARNLPIGTQKLIGVARALCAEPKLLLLDEPSSGLTRDEKEDLARFLLRIKYEKEIPILWVEHDLSLIGELGDELIVLNEGKKLAEGTIEQISERPEVLEIFGGFGEEACA